MSEVTQLGYLGLGVRDLGQWASYADETLGLERVATDADGAMLLRLDEHFYRFAVHEADEDDLTYRGWQVDNASDLAAIGARLEAAGTNVARATKEGRTPTMLLLQNSHSPIGRNAAKLPN